jgi:DNA-binding response OmpR family regulator
VVDDDPDLCDMIAICLTSEGYVVSSARDGQQALAEAERFAPSMILLDLWLPRLDGRGFAARLRAGGDDTPLIVLSAADDGPTVARDIGAVAYLAKPFGLDDLLALVGRVVRESQGRQTVAVPR